MTKDKILSDLDQAQRLLSNVYHYAQDINDGNIERLMSVADSCIIDAIDAIDNKLSKARLEFNTLIQDDVDFSDMYTDDDMGFKAWLDDYAVLEERAQ
jgi:hypothetical protein